MTKSDMVDIISSSVGLTKVETEAVVNGFMETVIDAMKRGDISNFVVLAVLK